MNNAEDRREDTAPDEAPAGEPREGEPRETGPPPPQKEYDYEPPRGRRGRWSRETSTAFDPRRKNVVLACILSAMPGLGQIYVGYYQRGFVHIIAIAGIIAMLASDLPDPLYPFLGFFLPFFWLYNIVDAGRRAAFYNQALAGTDPLELPQDFTMPGVGGSVFGGSVLIGLGTLLLFHTRFDMSLDWVEEWWPLGPIVFGAYLVYRGVNKKAS